jgi:hypothetical protein
MIAKAHKYVTNARGQRKGVLLSVGEYKKILADLEELAAIRAYDMAKASGEKPIPFDQALKEIKRRRG